MIVNEIQIWMGGYDNGKTWVSDVDNNVWEPGEYGWTEI